MPSQSYSEPFPNGFVTLDEVIDPPDAKYSPPPSPTKMLEPSESDYKACPRSVYIQFRKVPSAQEIISSIRDSKSRPVMIKPLKNGFMRIKFKTISMRNKFKEIIENARAPSIISHRDYAVYFEYFSPHLKVPFPSHKRFKGNTPGISMKMLQKAETHHTHIEDSSNRKELNKTTELTIE